MDESCIKRINELAALKKIRPLTEQEQEERELLRQQYIEQMKSSLRAHLESVVIQRPDGTRVKVRPSVTNSDDFPLQ